MGGKSQEMNPSQQQFSLKRAASKKQLPISSRVRTGALAALGMAAAFFAQAAPQVTEVIPASGATGVAVDSPIVFRFSEPMFTLLPPIPSMPGLFVGNIEWTPSDLLFQYAWSEDGLSLTCTPASNLPADTTITWRLNPAGTLVPLMSATEQPLPMTEGSFQTGSAGGGGGDCDPDGVPSDWGTYWIAKQSFYEQSSPGTPSPAADGPFSFGALVRAPADGPSITEASLILPDAVSKPLQGLPLGAGFAFASVSATEEIVDQRFPAGTYTLVFTQEGVGPLSFPMSMPAGHPPVPRFSNYSAAQAVDVNQPFTLRWDAFTGAGADDLQVLCINDSAGDTVFLAPDACVPRDLPVGANSIEIPAGTLADNQTYRVNLSFIRRFYFSTNALPRMNGFGIVSRSTEMTLRTGAPAAADPAKFTGYRLLPNGHPELTLTGTPGATYAIQRASSLASGGAAWSEVGNVTMNASGEAVFEHAAPDWGSPQFYRAVAP